MKLAMYTPLPPARTGVTHYVSMLTPALRQKAEVELIGPGHRHPVTGHRVYQLGNNPHHEFVYRQAMENPGVIVLHDVVLHHLIVEMTLARGDVEGYVQALRANHGEAGAAWARGRAAGLHSEMGNFLLPASIDVANRSRAVIVHNQWARHLLLSFGVSTPIHVVPHPYVHREVRDERAGAADRVIGFFGFLTSAKRGDVVLEAFRRARKDHPRLKLLIVGEPAPNIDVQEIAGDGVAFTGYVSDGEFDACYGRVDRLINLRYPSAGETSGTLIRAFDAGKPVAVSDYAQFAEYPDSCVVRIPLGEGEVDALADFFLRDIASPAAAQRQWLEQNAPLDLTVEGYLRVAAAAPARRPAPEAGAAALPLFARIEIVRAEARNDRLTMALRNIGAETIRTRVYGQPGYRAVVKLMAGDRVVQDRWIELPCDLRPGETAEVVIPLYVDAEKVSLINALEGIPIVDSRPAAAAEIVRVR